METLNGTGEIVLISGRSRLNRKGSGGQDALVQTHFVTLVPVYTWQWCLSYKSVWLMWRFLFIRYQCNLSLGISVAFLHPSLKLDLMSSFWKVGEKYVMACHYFHSQLKRNLLGLFLIFSLVLCRLWMDCWQKTPTYQVAFSSPLINVIQGNASHFYLKTNKSGSSANIRYYLNVTEKWREGRVIPFEPVFYFHSDIFS